MGQIKLDVLCKLSEATVFNPDPFASNTAAFNPRSKPPPFAYGDLFKSVKKLSNFIKLLICIYFQFVCQDLYIYKLDKVEGVSLTKTSVLAFPLYFSKSTVQLHDNRDPSDCQIYFWHLV